MRNTGFDIIERILAARDPAAPPDVRRARAAVVMGTVEGVATALDRVTAKQARVVEELTRAVTAYLETMD